MDDWSASVDLGDVARVVAAARARGLFSDAAPAVLFHDLGRMRARLRRVAAAFPAGTLHAVAIKANPLVEVLRALVAAGAGLEAASWEEVRLALAAGCPPERLVFDSPAKTRTELAEALRLGVHVNADNAAELERIAALGPRGGVGLRVNPQVGAGTIGLTSVADQVSKFGVPLDDPDLPALLDRFPWLTGLHVHVGSQGCGLPLLVEGVRRVWALRTPRTTTFDLGGGLPFAYRPGEIAPTPEAYVAALRAAIPDLFDGSVRLVTEFGRALQAPCGWAASRVEYVKRAGEVSIATLHLGGDLLVRATLLPHQWHHELAVLDPEGRLKSHEAPSGRWMIAGPLCFGGDVLARDLTLPPIEPGDLVLIRDVGAYALSHWSRNCSRGLPPVLGYDGPEVRVLRPRERAEDVVAFWSGDLPGPGESPR
jgi:diaminopimelate decarboxylase